MTFFIFFDTNSLRKKDLSLDDKLQVIVAHSEKYKIQLAISRVVYLELANQGEREFKYVNRFYGEYARIFKNHLFDQSEVPSMQPYVDEDRILKPLLGLGFVFVDNTHEDIYVAINSMYKGLRPSKSQGNEKILGSGTKSNEYELNPYDDSFIDFRYKENGIKDVFIWRCMIPIVMSSHSNHVAFITSNTKDFCEPNNAKMPHAQLLEELPENLRDRIVIMKDMDELHEYHIKFIERFDVAALDILRYVNLSDKIGSLIDIFEDFEISEVREYSVLEVVAVCRFKALLKIVYKPISDEYCDLNEEKEIWLSVDVSRGGEESSETYSLNYLFGIDEGFASDHGWTWPLAEGEFLEKLPELQQIAIGGPG